MRRLDVALDALAVADGKGFRRGVLDAIAGGARLVSLFGRRSGDEVVVTALLLLADEGLVALRGKVDAKDGYHALSDGHLPAAVLERELHEQTGVRLPGHPWLKPVRFPTGERAAMDAYPFHTIAGKEVHQVAVGPVHAGVIEPGAFRFLCHGELVHHLEIHLGYQHRGVEARLLAGEARRLAPLVETIAGDTSIAHTWAYAAALEQLCGPHVVDDGVELWRAVLLEWERIAMHLAGLAGLAADIGFLQGATTYGRLRTTAINTTMRLCGSRFGRGAVRPGGVAVRCDASIREAVRAGLALLQRDLPIIDACFAEARTVQHRLREVGVLTAARAEELGLVGMAARASGLARDLRRGAPSGAYASLPIEPVVLDSGDCWARGMLRIAELERSLAWIAAALGTLPEEAPPRPDPLALGAVAPSRLSIVLVEGWRGEVMHAIETDGEGKILHYKVQDPSLRNWMGLQLAVRGNEISDFPICNKSFDLSYCGSDL